MLEIKDLHARIDEREILKGLTLTVKPGEVHAIMGPNAAGKSTLAKVLCGHEDYEVTGGAATLDGKDLLDMDPEERAREGVFLSFQHPVEIPGVTNAYFMRSALNAQRQHRGEEEIAPGDFIKLAREKMALVKMPEDLLNRSINEGFSGGEKKRNEIFQMAMLDPRLAILDETDSGLDIDALRTIAEGVNSLRNENRMLIVITHYQRLLDHLVPDHTHVLLGGRIVKSAGRELVGELEERGYQWIEDEIAASA